MTFNANLQRKADNFKRRAGIKYDRGRIADTTNAAKAGYVWVEQQTGPNAYLKPVQILNQTGINRIGAHVLIGRTEDNEPVVVDIDVIAENQRGSDAAGSQENSQTKWVLKELLVELIPLAIGGTEIAVGPGFLPNGGYFPGAQTSTLDTIIGNLSSGEQILAAVHVTPAGTLESPTSTAQSALDPLTGADLSEALAGASPGAIPIVAVQLTEGQTDIAADSFWADLRILFAAPVAYSEANVSSSPTDAELTSAFGTPSAIGRMIGIVNDAGAGSAEYLVWCDGANYFYVAGTVAS